MKLTFKIQYHTVWGKQLFIVGSLPSLGRDIRTKALAMNYIENGNWEASINIKKTAEFSYKYIVMDADMDYIEEWGTDRKVKLSDSFSEYFFEDAWRTNGEDKTFFSSAFTESLIVRPKQNNTLPRIDSNKVLRFSIDAPRIGKDLCFAIIGNIKQLGNWEANNAIVMNDDNFPQWQAEIDASDIIAPIEYKYVIYNPERKIVVSWENGPNRTIQKLDIKKGIYVKTDETFHYDIPNWRGSGVAIPIFSLRTKESFGIGEFSDLKKMVDWASITGQKVIQTLPINDTTRTRTNADSYPYSSITVLALHPVYINIFGLGILKNKTEMKKFEKLQVELNNTETVKYQEVVSAKWDYFRQIYQQEKTKTFQSKEYKTFFEENRHWLLPYGAFCYLRDKNGDSKFNNWGYFSVFDWDKIDDFFKPEAEMTDEANIHLYLQFHAHKQLLDASNYAKQKGVILKGDIPIGISPDSVEAWMEPCLFNLDSQAGAPPDPFSTTGQNWGFPTYNWERMERDNYQWWRTRFQKMATYFQAYRIDHVLGFFRIWRMSSHDVQGLLGHFDPALPFTEEEIRNFGIEFDYDRMVLPYITEDVLQNHFGKYTNSVKERFLDMEKPGFYSFKDIYNTQKKIEAFFIKNDEKLEPEKLSIIRDGLYALFCEVLFIEDNKEEGKFHPRIAFHSTFSYRELNDETKNGLNNLYNHFYYQRHNDFWKEQAMKKLPALLKATNMLVCGEDLGMIPECVPHVMKDLFILSLEIERMPKDPREEFVALQNIPYLSVCTTSTHDMNPIRSWWEENKNLTQHYFNNVLGEWGAAPLFCEPWICEKIINRHLNSPAMLVILPFQDWMSINGKYRRQNLTEERINVPSDPHHFWCYRMHLPIEELLTLNELNDKMIEMTVNSARNKQF